MKADFDRLDAEERNSEAGQSLQRQLSQLKALEALQTGNAELVQRASVPDSPSSPKTLRNTVFGGILGLLVGCGLAVLFERLDRRLRAPPEFEEAFGLPVLTTIPERKQFARDEHRNGEPAQTPTPRRFECCGLACATSTSTAISARYWSHRRPPGDGKTTVAWNLAASAAAAGVRSVLVEADFHRPTVAERVGAAPIPGLSELLSGQAPFENAVQHVAVEDRANGHKPERALDFIVAGSLPPNPGELLESDGMARLVEHLMGEYDLLVVDTPPISLLADAIPLLRHVSGVIVVGQLNKTTRDEATELQRQLGNFDAPTLGVVANRASPRGRYGYGYYGYEANAAQPERPELVRPVDSV